MYLLPEEVAEHFLAVLHRSVEGSERPQYNIAPTAQALVVRVRRDADGNGVQHEIAAMRWGLVPHWADDESIGNRLANARSESAATKPAFRDAIVNHRCIVPASAFFEWSEVEGEQPKQPWMISAADGQPLALAGLWSSWRPADADHSSAPLRTFTILTMAASGDLATIHPRMPVMLDQDRWSCWLGDDAAAAKQMLESMRSAGVAVRREPVSRVVNDARNDTPACMTVEPPPPPEAGTLWGV